MRKFITSICLLMLLFNMTFAANADGSFIPLSMITGDYSVNQVTLTCKYCHNRVANVYCAGGSGYADDVGCSISDHLPCTIKERVRASANAYCSICGFSYPWDWGNGGTNEGHIDSCVHYSRIGRLAYDNVCNYGPRA